MKTVKSLYIVLLLQYWGFMTRVSAILSPRVGLKGARQSHMLIFITVHHRNLDGSDFLRWTH